MMILEDYLERNAQRYPQKAAVVCEGKAYTYKTLLDMVLTRTEAMKKQYRPGQAVALRAMPMADYLADYFALHRAGCVAVPLERDIPETKFQEITRRLSDISTPEGTADILYTTGTTGQSKGVMISHRTIVADAENLIDGQGFTHELAFVVNGPMNHIGSLSKVYPVIMVGATLIIVDGLKDMNRFFAAFDYPAKKMATFLVPASIRMLIQFGSEKLAKLADKMDFIETGAAAIAQADMEQLCELLPKTRLYNTYASTETGIIATHDYNHGECLAGCLGKPMKHSRIIITEEGRIACQGDTLMTGYAGDPERTAAILRDATVYTSDIGILDAEGRLHLKGREDDAINVGGFKVAPTEVEDAAMSYAKLNDCICIAKDHPITGKALKLLVETKGGEKLNKRELAQHLKERLELYKVPMFYEQVESVARTFNGKPNRKRYR